MPAEAYRALLGRSPTAEEMAARAGLGPAALRAAVVRSAEFGTVLSRLAAGRLTRHVTLSPEELRSAWDWAAREGLLSPAALALPCSPGTLTAGLLGAPEIAARITGLPAAQQARLAALAADPARSPCHLATQTAGEEDRRLLAALLFAGPPEAHLPVGQALPLAVLLRQTLESPACRAAVIQPLLAGSALPEARLDPSSRAAVAAWLQERLGAEPPTLWPGGLVGALFRLSFVAEMLGLLFPGEQAALNAALPGLSSGLAHLRGARIGGEDVAMSYLGVLGRPVESPAIAAAHAGGTLWGLLCSLLASPEFRERVLHRLVGDHAVPHLGLSPAQLIELDGWLSQRLCLPPAPPDALALLHALLTLPAVAEELTRLHGLLWTDARAALEEGMAAARGSATGAIAYVTGDLIVGWAEDRARPGEPLEVELRCNGSPVGFGRADRQRRDAPDAPASGFRLQWDGRAARGSGPRRFRIHDARTGRPIGQEFLLETLFAEAEETVQRLAAELAEARALLQRLEMMLPQVESFAAWPPALHGTFRHRHAITPPAGPTAPLHLMLETAGATVRGLRRTLDSLAAQTATDWTTTLLVPESGGLRALAEQAAARDPRISLGKTGAERELPQASLLLLASAGTLFAPAAFAWFGHALAAHPTSVAAYSDEDAVTERFRDHPLHHDPVLREALDPWRFAFANPAGELVCARREALLAAWEAVGSATSRWLLWAALARQGPVAHIPRLLHARLAEDSVAPAAPEMPPPGLRPLLRHPWLLDPPATWPGDETRISVIVPTRNGGTMLREALASLAAKAARPTLLEPLVIDNGSDAPETLAILAGLGCPVLRLDEPFNWSRLNNQAVARTRGGILLFLNDDTRMLSEGWDLWLRRLLAEPEVGAVGARLLYEDMTIQHAGVLLGQEKLAAHEGVGAAAEEGGPGGRWQALRAAGAVTGAFLGCRREAFLGVGGFDETSLPITFNDVDLCLKLRAAGLQVLYAPQIALLHYESKSRGHDDADRGRQERAEAEAQRLTERWGEGLLLDPGCNPHWSRWARPFSALREPSAAEIARHLAATASERPWDPLGALPPGPRQRALPSALPPGGRASLRTLP
ncbi:glycosyltransferase [Siccirubricoccus sp. KC 17139]|uniref:Glycosyltransferase n=1 Tax=Siccirubricoccus soli TaxID=2899147 RepID=A0ABT1D322_9PROT|nr:glycosyltransferase [Siccirubricoccus soli]MCP2682472.1 glycosyltransferase [Siccirubricoccus soli]